MNGFLQDSTGNNSSYRLAYLIVIVLVMGMWIFMSVTKHELVELPATILSLLVVLAGGKVLQSNVELNATTTKGN